MIEAGEEMTSVRTTFEARQIKTSGVLNQRRLNSAPTKFRFSSATGAPARNYQKQDMRARPEPHATAPEVFAGATIDSRRKAAHEGVSEEDKSKSMVAASALCGRRALDGCCQDRSDWPWREHHLDISAEALEWDQAWRAWGTRMHKSRLMRG
jgi:hypothetical protein